MAENNNDDFKQMSKEEKDKLAHEIVIGQFLFGQFFQLMVGKKIKK